MFITSTRRFGTALAFVCAASASGTAQPVQRTTLADGIYLFTVPSEVNRWTGSNSVVIVNDRAVPIFDTNARPSSTRRVLAEVRALTTKPVRTLINSHRHLDHWMGNEVYADAFPGLQIVATMTTRDFMKRMPAPYFFDQSGIARQRARVDSARRAGASPALREDAEGVQPWTTNSYQISPWLASLKRLEALDLATIVPGQGPAMRDEEFLRNTIAMYEAIITQVHAALERGVVRLADVQAAVRLDEIRQRFTKGDATLDAEFRRVAAGLIAKVFQEAHDGVVGR